MRIGLCYIFPMVNIGVYGPLAKRFVGSYFAHPPGDTPHEIHILVNGSAIGPVQRKIFDALPCHFHSYSNFGKDIGAFQRAGVEIPCDLLLCFGAPVHFRQAGWLDVIANAYVQNGPALYGAWAFHQPAFHIRTTAFWLPPDLLNAYPYQIGDGQRYEFEHGANSITRFAIDNGFGALQLTWSGVFPPAGWHHTENAESLLLDQHTDRMGYQ